jgi:chaperonin GroEL
VHELCVVAQRVDDSNDVNFGYNAATRQYGDLLKMGVIDPAKVTRLALQNAASIAALILTTDCMIAAAPQANKTTDTALSPGVGQQLDMF